MCLRPKSMHLQADARLLHSVGTVLMAGAPFGGNENPTGGLQLATLVRVTLAATLATAMFGGSENPEGGLQLATLARVTLAASQATATSVLIIVLASVTRVSASARERHPIHSRVV